MRTQHIPMTIEEYRSRPFRIGWKEEYWDGMARICPSDRLAIVSMPISVKTVASPFPMCVVVTDDAPALINAFYAAFWDTCEYCDYSEADMRKSARDSIRTFLAAHGVIFCPRLVSPLPRLSRTRLQARPCWFATTWGRTMNQKVEKQKEEELFPRVNT